MQDRSALVRELTDLGVTQYEAKAYLALLGRDRYTAAELARESGIPRQRVYDVLGGLAERGLIRMIPGQVVRYSAVDPAAAVNRLMAVHRANFDRLDQAAVQLSEALVPLYTSGRGQTDPLDYVEVIRDPHVLAERFAEMQTSAERQLLTCAKLPYLLDSNPDGLRVTRRLARTGGDVRCVYEQAMLDYPEYVADTDRFVAAGEQARVASSVPLRLCIADGSHVLMSLRDPVAGGVSNTNILIEHPALAQCLIYAFETLWSGAVDLATAIAQHTRSTAEGKDDSLTQRLGKIAADRAEPGAARTSTGGAAPAGRAFPNGAGALADR